MTSWNERPTCFASIMEEAECGNLRNLLVAHEEIPTISWKLRLRFVTEIAEALKYLHHDIKRKKSFLHLDIKPENVLLTKHLQIKLADFGSLGIALATNAQPTIILDRSKQFTPFYAAPERLKDIAGEPKSSMDVYR